MFKVFRILPSASTILETKNLVSISYTDLTVEPSIFHKHNEIEILLPVSGEGTLLTHYKSSPFVPRHLYIVNPQTTHTEKTTTILKYYVVKMKNISLFNCTDRFSDISLTEIEFQLLESLLADAMKALQTNEKYSEKISYLHLATFYYQVKQILFKKSKKFCSAISRTSTELVDEIKKYITENYGLKLKIGSIAKNFAISPNHMTAIFKKEMGYSPQQFLLATRINAAKYLLSSSNYNILQITSLCGFNSPAHFTEIFKKYTHSTPSEYRKKEFRLVRH